MKNLPPVKESEETEVKKNIKWLKEEIAIEMLQLERNRKERWSDVKYQTLRSVVQKIVQLDEPETLSQKWIDEHKEGIAWSSTDTDASEVTYYIKEDDLQNLLVPEQELPVIPKFVAEWIEEAKPDKSLRVAFEYIAERKRNNYSDELASWVYEGNSETLARAWLDGYTVEKEPKYFAKIKGHENISSDDKYWNYCITDKSLDIGDNKVHADVLNEYVLNATKDEWANLGISDDNADFVEVEEL